ncbi:hypothetical protein FOZ76_08615 [Verticiella sediminum]|uniref:Uncharacterized protein n=1 Tax=Verticiella sediminum TaxID=1247510 RepID=A0A556AUL6_9BURK|nr:hypothetical protein FOZ76_08615 [Verticiella sediminum]
MDCSAWLNKLSRWSHANPVHLCHRRPRSDPGHAIACASKPWGAGHTVCASMREVAGRNARRADELAAISGIARRSHDWTPATGGQPPPRASAHC